MILSGYRVLGACAGLAAAMALAGCHTAPSLGHDHAAYGMEHVCSSCHGLEGRSKNGTFPNLAGQQKDYLVAQLQAFHGKTRADPHARTYMFGMAATLDDATIDKLAGFYASQPPAAGTGGNPVAMAAGEVIFKNGIDAENVPACGACHGDHAEGNSTIPRLAGQHPGYLAGQLRAFRINSRANEMMHANAKSMTDGQIDAVAAYLGSL
jgi:cytochrome c553